MISVKILLSIKKERGKQVNYYLVLNPKFLCILPYLLEDFS